MVSPSLAPHCTQAQVLLWLTKALTVPAPAHALALNTPHAGGVAHPLLGRKYPPRERSWLTFSPPAGSLPGFYLAIPSKSLSKQYGFLTFFCGKVNSQHISNSRALLFFGGGCRGSALPCCAGLGCGTPLCSPREENTGKGVIKPAWPEGSAT